MREWTCGEQCLKCLKRDPKEFMDYKIWIWIWNFLTYHMCLIGSRSSANRKNWGCDCDRHRQETGKIPVLLWPMCIYICVYIYVYIYIYTPTGIDAWATLQKQCVQRQPIIQFSQLQVWDLTIRKPYSYKLVYNPIHLYIYYIRQNSKS